MKAMPQNTTNTAGRTPVLLFSVIVIACFSSCNNNKRKDDAAKTIAQWTGKTIKFPTNIPCSSIGKDTICPDLYNDNYKIMLYVDSTGCTSCRLKLPQWKKIIAAADTAFEKRPDFLFFFQPKKSEEKQLQFIFKQNGFRHPVFIDKENKIGKLNNFPSKSEYQCFLLDKNNSVLLVGNPSYNPGIWALFKKVILKRENKETPLQKGGTE